MPSSPPFEASAPDPSLRHQEHRLTHGAHPHGTPLPGAPGHRREDAPYGWGFAWYPAQTSCAMVIKDPTSTGENAMTKLLYGWERFESTVFVCHLRGAARTLIEQDTQPFSKSYAGRDFVLAHNGDLMVDRATALPLTDPSFEPLGGTDSEHAFAWLLQQMRTTGARRLAEIGWPRLHRWLCSLDDLGTANFLLTDGIDLCAYRDAGLAVWLQREDGSFAAKPDRERELDLVSRDEGEGEGSQAFKNVRLELRDLDGDGRADLIATRIQGEVGVFSSLRTQLIVFRGGAEGFDEAHPTTVLNFKGMAIDPEWVDLNGDGRLDAVVSTFRMDMLTNVKRAVLESMTITYNLHLQGPGATLGEDAAFSLDVDVPLSALERNGGSRAALFSAELTGDGVRDMIAREPDGGLVIYPGALDGDEIVFDEADPLRLKIYRCLPPLAIDLDGDGVDELLLEPFGGDGPVHRTVRLVAVSK